MTDLDDLFDQLKQKRDEVRVQIHLASKEVQEEWHELEKKMEDFSAKAKLAESSTGVGQALGELGSELKKGYKRIRDAIKDD
jgi:vacuolar-type H+-ATPase subunit D/Vma8